MNAIELNNVDFSYNKKQPLLSKLNLNVPVGNIYGFLGPNGSGKTTTLKLILNLLKNKSQGTIHILGKEKEQHYPNYLKQIGSLIEDASIYGHLSAKENLKIWCNFHGLNLKRIDEVLEIINLTHTGNKRAKAFSTGMKQRLGIGIAIMHDPEILILDEPTNGLDPMGINDLRLLMSNLKSQGKTILLSSHILSEVEKIVDEVGIIKDGNILFEGTLEALKNKAGINSKIILSVNNNELANSVLESKFSCQVVNDDLEVAINSPDDVNQVVKMLIDKDVKLYEVIRPKKNLETIFMNLAK